MNLPLFVAWRYVFSKKKLGIIHIISLISLIGIAIATMALIVVLSVFNGFTKVATDMLNRSNPPIIIEAKTGKTININQIDYKKISQLKEIGNISPVITESALLSCGESQSIVKIRTCDTIKNNCLLGEYLASSMGLRKEFATRGISIKLTIPKRETNSSSIIPQESFNTEILSFGGIISTQSKLDESFVLVPLNVARQLLDYEKHEFSSIFISPKRVKDLPKLQSEITKIVGDNYTVKNIFEQEPIYYKIVKAEKLGVYLILAFIIFIATFNIVGSLSLLILDKRKDINILHSMGMSLNKVRMIYFFNGLILSIFGALIGIVVGFAICFIQSQFGLIRMGADNFIVESFPIQIKAFDVLNVFLLVVLMGSLSIGVMVRRIKF
jgi:lipoprotein-releasing system permease protein